MDSKQNPSFTPSVVNNAIANEIDTLLNKERRGETQIDNTYADIKSYKYHTMSPLSINKLLLHEHHQNNNKAIPKGLLVPEVKSTSRLSDSERLKWQGILQGTCRQLRNLPILDHKRNVEKQKQKWETLKRKLSTERYPN